jgi:E2/UBC family protein E
MNDLTEHVKSLKLAGYDVAEPQQGPGETYIIVRGVSVAPGLYSAPQTDVLVRVPNGYPNAGLDMFYVPPEFLLTTGRPPQAGEVLENLGGRLWRRISWHRNLPWIPGRDSLLSFLSFVQDNLAGGR